MVLPALLAAVLLAAGCSDPAAPPSAPPAPTRTGGSTPPEEPPPLRVGAPAWVTVAVATLWRSPASPRAVDAPAVAHPAGIREWLDAMTLEERRGLDGLADTQVLLGDGVRVVRLRPRWAKVVVPDQPTPLDARGYPGWVPRRQLTAIEPAVTLRTATVTTRTAWLRTDAAGTEPLEVSFGTRLPVLAATSSSVRVRLPDGEVRRVARSDVVVHDTGAPAYPPTRDGLVERSRTFVGLDYLWAGTSGFGVDCSGLTWLTYRVHGVRIPRDASAQYAAGTPADPRLPGDLVFFGDPVRHVGLYTGDGAMVHAPGTGERVVVAPVPATDYAGVRRLLP